MLGWFKRLAYGAEYIVAQQNWGAGELKEPEGHGWVLVTVAAVNGIFFSVWKR